MHHTPYQSTMQHAVPWGGAVQRSCDQVIALVAQRKNVPIRLLIDTKRGRRSSARARQLAMYLSHVVYGRSLAEIGKAFGRDRTTVSYACALIEDMRDDPRFDEEVCALELQLETAMAAEVDDVR
ncbi:MAG: chromosomal replication initiator DnaA [Devosia sp.]|nr:chromosomal replication initiator DnaA [Devosia sp.]